MESPLDHSTTTQQWHQYRGGEAGPSQWHPYSNGEAGPALWRSEPLSPDMGGPHRAESRHWRQQNHAKQGGDYTEQGSWQQRQRQDSSTARQQQYSNTAWQQEEDNPVWQHRHSRHWQELQQQCWHRSQQQEQQRRWQQRQEVQLRAAEQQQRGEGRREAVKRSCSYLRSGDGEEDSEEEEALPSSKRQRVSVSAMERLFAACSLRGDGALDCSQAKDAATAQGSASRMRETESGIRGNIPKHFWSTGTTPANDGNQKPPFHSRDGGADREEVSLQRGQSLLEDDTDQEPKPRKRHGTSITSPQNKDSDGPPTREHGADSSPVDDGRGTTALRDSSSAGNSRDEAEQESGEEEAGGTASGSVQQRSAMGGGKRSADDEEERGVQHSKEEEEAQHLSKRVRKLKRGLRLCSNITCYIEQVLYNS